MNIVDMAEYNEIKNDAEYCLNCKLKPCSEKGCPVKTNIPEFINEIKNNNLENAYKILKENNIFSHVCSIVCPQEDQCEGSCIRGIKQTSTNIGKLERYVNEYAVKNNLEINFSKKNLNGKKVAIVGSGPSGLECAFELLKNGFEVDIYDKESIPGGILVYGIPDFRLSKDIVYNIIDVLKKLGANFILNKTLGKDYKLENLRKEYDAVFLGIGSCISMSYSLSDKELNSVYDSEEFLKAYSNKNYINNLGTVVVIGGGNVAMDSARVAVKMGADKVKILYRRDRAHMPARDIELDEAISEGVEFKELVRVESCNLDSNDNIISVNCIPTEIVDGKAKDKENAKSYVEEANTVVFAIGLKPEKQVLEDEKIELNEWGYIKVDENLKTNFENVYAGGDVIGEKATVCKAIASGRKAADSIIQKLK